MTDINFTPSFLPVASSTTLWNRITETIVINHIKVNNDVEDSISQLQTLALPMNDAPAMEAISSDVDTQLISKKASTELENAVSSNACIFMISKVDAFIMKKALNRINVTGPTMIDRALQSWTQPIASETQSQNCWALVRYTAPYKHRPFHKDTETVFKVVGILEWVQNIVVALCDDRQLHVINSAMESWFPSIATKTHDVESISRALFICAPAHLYRLPAYNHRNTIDIPFDTIRMALQPVIIRYTNPGLNVIVWALMSWVSLAAHELEVSKLSKPFTMIKSDKASDLQIRELLAIVTDMTNARTPVHKYRRTSELLEYLEDLAIDNSKTVNEVPRDMRLRGALNSPSH
jgi:hypothetical protein